MMKTLTMTSALALVLVAGHASAQELTYGAGSISAGQIATDSTDLNSFALEGDVEFTYDQFLFGASAKSQTFDTGGGSGTIASYDAFVGYMPTAEVLVGAGLTGVSIEGSDGFSGYEAFAQYDTGQYGVAVRYEAPNSDVDEFSITSIFGRAAVSPEVTVGAVIDSVSEFDEILYGVSAEYDAGPIFARGYYNGVTGQDISLWGVRGSYDFNQGLFASAEFQQTDGFFGDDVSVYAIGGGYRFSDNAYVDASIGQLDASGDTATTMQIGLTFETGNRQRMDAEMSDAIRADFDGGYGQIVPDFGLGTFPFIF